MPNDLWVDSWFREFDGAFSPHFFQEKYTKKPPIPTFAITSALPHERMGPKHLRPNKARDGGVSVRREPLSEAMRGHNATESAMADPSPGFSTLSSVEETDGANGVGNGIEAAVPHSFARMEGAGIQWGTDRFHSEMTQKGRGAQTFWQARQLLEAAVWIQRLHSFVHRTGARFRAGASRRAGPPGS